MILTDKRCLPLFGPKYQKPKPKVKKSDLKSQKERNEWLCYLCRDPKCLESGSKLRQECPMNHDEKDCDKRKEEYLRYYCRQHQSTGKCEKKFCLYNHDKEDADRREAALQAKRDNRGDDEDAELTFQPKLTKCPAYVTRIARGLALTGRSTKKVEAPSKPDFRF